MLFLAYICLQMLTDAYTCLQMLTHAYRCLHMLTQVLRYRMLLIHFGSCDQDLREFAQRIYRTTSLNPFKFTPITQDKRLFTFGRPKLRFKDLVKSDPKACD